MTCSKCKRRSSLRGRARCRVCLVSDREADRRLLRERREAGLCPCGAVAAPDRRHCRPCLDYHNNRQKVRLRMMGVKPRPAVPSTYERILRRLRRGPATGKELSQMLELKHKGIYVMMRRLEEQGKVFQLPDGRWAAPFVINVFWGRPQIYTGGSR